MGCRNSYAACVAAIASALETRGATLEADPAHPPRITRAPIEAEDANSSVASAPREPSPDDSSVASSTADSGCSIRALRACPAISSTATDGADGMEL